MVHLYHFLCNCLINGAARNRDFLLLHSVFGCFTVWLLILHTMSDLGITMSDWGVQYLFKNGRTRRTSINRYKDNWPIFFKAFWGCLGLQPGSRRFPEFFEGWSYFYRAIIVAVFYYVLHNFYLSWLLLVSVFCLYCYVMWY